jgi:uncharacterized membrane protein
LASPTDVGSSDSPIIRQSLPVRTITQDDLIRAVRLGWADFSEMPTYSIFLGLFYVLAGLVLYQIVFNAGTLQLAFPLVAGFALIGPFAALGMYELSRRRQHGLDTSQWRMLQAFTSPATPSILIMGAILTAIFLLWLQTAMLLYTATLGAPPEGVRDLLVRVLTTPGGWALVIFGNGIGAIFALVVFSISVVSFPLLLDRNVGVTSAIATSVAAVRANPRVMLAWGAFVAGSFAIGCIPHFLGIAVIFPLLGHASWHLYRRVVPPA